MIEKNFKAYIYKPEVPLRQAVNDLYRKATTICLVCAPDKTLLGWIKQAAKLNAAGGPARPVAGLERVEVVRGERRHDADEADRDENLDEGEAAVGVRLVHARSDGGGSHRPRYSEQDMVQRSRDDFRRARAASAPSGGACCSVCRRGW